MVCASVRAIIHSLLKLVDYHPVNKNNPYNNFHIFIIYLFCRSCLMFNIESKRQCYLWCLVWIFHYFETFCCLSDFINESFKIYLILTDKHMNACADPEGRAVLSLHETHNAIRFLSNTGPYPMKYPIAFNVWPSSARKLNAIYRWRADDGPLLLVFGTSLPTSIKTRNEKDVVCHNFLDPRMKKG